MSTTAKSLPPHGTHGRAVGRPAAGIKGCKCRPCRDANNAYNKLRRYLADTGRSLTIDAGPAAEHLRLLLAAGNGWKRTAKQLGCNVSQVYRLASGEQKTIGRGRAEKILALRPEPQPETLTNALGSIRRARALSADGHMHKVIADAAGLEITVVNDLISGVKTQIRRATAEAIDYAYSTLQRTSAPAGRGATRARNRAARAGWPTPAQWAEEIDNPDADPLSWVRIDGCRSAEELVADAEEIRRTWGVNWDLVAERLQVKRNTLDKARERVAERAKRERVAA